jgi:hypothetical protein
LDVLVYVSPVDDECAVGDQSHREAGEEGVPLLKAILNYMIVVSLFAISLFNKYTFGFHSQPLFKIKQLKAKW